MCRRSFCTARRCCCWTVETDTTSRMPATATGAGPRGRRRAVDAEEFKRYTAPDRGCSIAISSLPTGAWFADRRCRSCRARVTRSRSCTRTARRSRCPRPTFAWWIIRRRRRARPQGPVAVVLAVCVRGDFAIGMDCSGMVRNVCGQTGWQWPRRGPAIPARPAVATRWHTDGIREGDILYFIDAREDLPHRHRDHATHFVHCSCRRFRSAAWPRATGCTWSTTPKPSSRPSAVTVQAAGPAGPRPGARLSALGIPVSAPTRAALRLPLATRWQASGLTAARLEPMARLGTHCGRASICWLDLLRETQGCKV